MKLVAEGQRNRQYATTPAHKTVKSPKRQDQDTETASKGVSVAMVDASAVDDLSVQLRAEEAKVRELELKLAESQVTSKTSAQ